jgi:peptide/nickel transport system substrate-binding protein
VTRLLHAGLFRLDPDDLSPQPYLARSASWLDDRTLRVELRDDVTFASGAPFTSDDVVATLRAYGTKAVASRLARVVEAIDDVRADGPHAVVVHLGEAHATLLTDLELPILRRDQAASAPAVEGLDGLGPFVLAHREGGALDLAPRTGGALPKPSHAVVVRTVRDENARALRFHAGQADIAVNGFSPTLLPALAHAPGVAVTSRPGAALTYLVMRVDRAPLSDLALRRAISLSIDRAGLARTLFGGLAHEASSLLPPMHWASTPGVAPLPFDLSEARRLLPAGPRPHLTWLTSTERLRISVARVCAQNLADAGIDVEVVPLELGTMLARLAAGDFDLATLVLPELTEPNVFRVFLHGDNVPPRGANRGRIHDARIDSLLDEGAATLDRERRRAIYAELDARVRELAVLLPLLHEDQVAVTSAAASGFRPSAEGRWLGLATLR